MDQPDTYKLLDFISYLCEFGFINFFDLRCCVSTTHKNATSIKEKTRERLSGGGRKDYKGLNLKTITKIKIS